MEEEKLKQEEKTLLSEAKQVADRIEAANKVTSDLIKRQEEIKAHEIISGKSEAGVPVKEKSKEEKSIESAREMLKGTGFEDRLFPVENK